MAKLQPFWFFLKPPWTYEDFLSYTEYDPYNQILVWSYLIDFVAPRNWDGYVYADKGSNHFGNSWEHRVDLKVLSGGVESLGGVAIGWALANSVDDQKGIIDALGSELSVSFYRSFAAGNPYYLVLQEVYMGSPQSTIHLINPETWYYVTIKRNGTALTCDIYTNPTRTILLASLSLTLNTLHPSHRYVYAAQTYNSGDNYVLTAYIANLALVS